MNLSEQFNEHFKKNLSIYFPANCKFIIAVSGGVDSIVLVDLFAKMNIDFVIAHCNFKLRGEESERDENFVRALSVKHSKEIFVKQFDTNKYAAENKLSIQVAARELRYSWFKEIQNSKFKIQNTSSSIPNSYLITAHHCNDNIETVLFNFFRGTGIQGLTGISAFDKERKMVRPLLPFKKEAILQYAKTNDLSYVEDSSNASNKYTRNSFRNQIIPLVVAHFPQVEENILSNINRLNDVEELYQQGIEKHKNNLIEQKGNELHIPILKLKKSKPLHTIIWEIIKDFDFTAAQTNEIVKLLDANNGSYVQSASHRIINNRNWLIITPIKEENAHHFIIEKEDKEIAFDTGKILQIHSLQYDDVNKELSQQLNNKHQTPNTKQANETALLDLANIEFPLLLRKWKQGDYFYPLGMNKKQKLSKFFINQKLSLIQKENVWVIESNKRIAWVVGYRIDNRFKITDTTKDIMKISL